MLKTLHLNCTVKVKLTDRGREVLKYSPPFIQEDDEGYVAWPLWILMHEIGPHLRVGTLFLFEDSIVLDEEALKELNPS